MSDRGRHETATDAERAAQRRHAAERGGAAAQPSEYPYPERRAGGPGPAPHQRAGAAADTPPGIPGGEGTTGGGRSGSAGDDE
ncbi:hypothetical protein ABZ079_24280 [Streptomyces sp. NPDC006314]|uniref:hypothetical protein n=1 Tax=Streptomyces sp. NPDC006314 TaxID=3154475 RepID=UPI0033B343AD